MRNKPLAGMLKASKKDSPFKASGNPDMARARTIEYEQQRKMDDDRAKVLSAQSRYGPSGRP